MGKRPLCTPLVYIELQTGRANSYGSGGIRGIAELEVLLHIEKALGGKIPIQSFFDLIVGTRLVLISLH